MIGSRRDESSPMRSRAAGLSVVLLLMAVVALPDGSADAQSAPPVPRPVSSAPAGPVRPATTSANQGVAVATNIDQTFQVFCFCGPDTAVLEYTKQFAPNQNFAPFLPVDPADRSPFSIPKVIANADGRLEVFITDGVSVKHSFQEEPRVLLSPMYRLDAPQPAGPIAVGRNGDGRLELFWQTCSTPCTEAVVSHAWQEFPGGPFGPPYPLSPTPVPVGTKAAFTNQDGSLGLLSYASGDGLVYQARQQPGGGWGLSTLTAPPGTTNATAIAVELNGDGRAEAFLATTSGLFHLWQVQPGGDWSPWLPLAAAPPGATVGDVAIGRNIDGRLEVFFVFQGGAAMHAWQEAAGGWGAAAPVGPNQSGQTLDTALAALLNQDGRMQVFFGGVDAHPRMATAFQKNPAVGPWSAVVPVRPGNP